VAFQIVRFGGSFYLIYLGVTALRHSEMAQREPLHGPASGWRILWHSVVASMTNPKTIVFFLSFLPQFVSDPSSHVARQLLVLGAIYMLLTVFVYGLVAYSAGHIGQIDISLNGPEVVGPDGGRGGLEGYIGGSALLARYGENAASQIRPEDLAFRALARTIRICHALYRPHHVCLAGGTGIRLAPLLIPLRAEIESALTTLARPGWTLSCGEDDFHAARGAARAAGRAINA